MNTKQKIEIAIRASLKNYDDPDYISWANEWLSGKNRAAGAARAAHAAGAAGAARAAAAAAAVVAAVGVEYWADKSIQCSRDLGVDINTITKEVLGK